MKYVTAINFYALISFSLLMAFVFIILLLGISKEKNTRNRKSYIQVFEAGLIISLLNVIASIATIIFKIQSILILSLTISSVVLIVFLIIAMNTRKKEYREFLKKEKENDAYINKLKNLPSEESNRAQHLLFTSRSLLNKATSSLTGKKDISNDIYNYAVKAFKDDLNADGVVLLIVDAMEEVFSVKALLGKFPPPYKLADDVVRKEDRVQTNFKYAEFSFGDNIFTEIAKNGSVKLIKDGSQSKLLPNNGPEEFLQHGSLIFFPLKANDSIIGMIVVSRSKGNKVFDNYDSKMGENLAGYVAEVVNLAVSINEANASAEIENITDTAMKIQKILLPKDFKKIPGLSISEFFLSARGICSDYYDVIPYKNRTFMVVVDVAGKSVEAAIIMVMIRAVLYLITNTGQDLESILNWLNKSITGKISIDHFASISLVCYDQKKQELEFIGAGNQAIMLCRNKTKKIELFQQKTDPIGVDLNSTYKSTKIPFVAGDTLAMYTDGLVESMNRNGEQYGIKRLASLIAENNDSTTKDIVKKIKSDVTAFIGKATVHDDHSLLIVKTK